VRCWLASAGTKVRVGGRDPVRDRSGPGLAVSLACRTPTDLAIDADANAMEKSVVPDKAQSAERTKGRSYHK
jgi:hypothetical protein